MYDSSGRYYTFGQDVGSIKFKKNMSEEETEEDEEVSNILERAQRIKLKNSSMNKDNLYDSYWGKYKRK